MIRGMLGNPLKKQMNNIARGPKKQHSQTWHEEITKFCQLGNIFNILLETVLVMRVHAGTMRAMMNNIIDHYRNKYDKVSAESRCKTDQKYEPRKVAYALLLRLTY